MLHVERLQSLIRRAVPDRRSHVGQHAVQQLAHVGPQAVGERDGLAEGRVGPHVRAALDVVELLANELPGKVTLLHGVGHGIARLALQRLREARFVVADVGQDPGPGVLGRIVPQRLGAGRPHEVPFALGARTVLAAIGAADGLAQGGAEPRPEDEDGDVDAAFSLQDHLDAVLERHVGHQRQVFPQDRLEGQTPDVAAPNSATTCWAFWRSSATSPGDEMKMRTVRGSIAALPGFAA